VVGLEVPAAALHLGEGDADEDVDRRVDRLRLRVAALEG
jgi:hypothetical protein